MMFPESVEALSIVLESYKNKTPNPLKFAGVPETNERISAASGPKFTIL